MKDPDDVIDTVKAWLSLLNNTRWLLVFDNYDNPKLPGNTDQEALVLVGTYVKERDNNRMKGGETGVVFWFKVYCLSMRDMGEAHILI